MKKRMIHFKEIFNWWSPWVTLKSKRYTGMRGRNSMASLPTILLVSKLKLLHPEKTSDLGKTDWLITIKSQEILQEHNLFLHLCLNSSNDSHMSYCLVLRITSNPCSPTYSHLLSFLPQMPKLLTVLYYLPLMKDHIVCQFLPEQVT